MFYTSNNTNIDFDKLVNTHTLQMGNNNATVKETGRKEIRLEKENRLVWERKKEGSRERKEKMKRMVARMRGERKE